jgi:hypothetical protein
MLYDYSYLSVYTDEEANCNIYTNIIFTPFYLTFLILRREEGKLKVVE